MTHELLTDEKDAPGDWEQGWIGGGYISFRLPAGQGPNGSIPDDEEHHVVIDLGGDRDAGEEERPVTVWTVTYPHEHILQNYRSVGEVIGEGVGISEGARIALEYMEDTNP